VNSEMLFCLLHRINDDDAVLARLMKMIKVIVSELDENILYSGVKCETPANVTGRRGNIEPDERYRFSHLLRNGAIMHISP